MLHVDWDSAKPGRDDVERVWETNTFDVVDPEMDAVDRYVQSMLDTRPRGGARLCCVRIPDSKTIDWYVANNALAEANFFTELLTSEAVTTELGIDADGDADPTFTVESALSLDGVLAEQLVHGGSKPYVDTIEQQYGGCASAKRLARDFTDDVVEDRYEEMTVHRTREPWSDWFGEPWWNFTLVVVDRRYRWAWVLVATDEGLMEAANHEALS